MTTSTLRTDFFDGVHMREDDKAFIEIFLGDNEIKLIPIIVPSLQLLLSEEEWNELHRLEKTELPMSEFKQKFKTYDDRTANEQRFNTNLISIFAKQQRHEMFQYIPECISNYVEIETSDYGRDYPSINWSKMVEMIGDGQELPAQERANFLFKAGRFAIIYFNALSYKMY
jgi:hypothetical protein